VIGVVAAIGFTVSLFFATAAFPGGAALAQTKMGALLSLVAAPVALVVSRIARTRDFPAQLETAVADPAPEVGSTSTGR
jgi:Na+/H+ antiporter NhaA